MSESGRLVPIPLRFEQVAYVEENSATAVASRVIEFLLATGGPQAKFAKVANRLAEEFGSVPSVAAEVRVLGTQVASLSPTSFGRLQELAWMDCGAA